MTPYDFVKKWTGMALTERSASQSHFIDLCKLLGVKAPTDADKKGTEYCFEKSLTKNYGGKGYADVWKKGFFGWEYKGLHKDLEEAYKQLKDYTDELENPPVLVTCDMDRFVIRSQFTGHAPQKYDVSLADLAHPDKLRILRSIFTSPTDLKPGAIRKIVTEEAARLFAEIAQDLRKATPPEIVAHFVNRLVFCMFAEDIGVLPDQVFTKMLTAAKEDPNQFPAMCKQLFGAMKDGGMAGWAKIEWFNGGLFDSDDVISLSAKQIDLALAASSLDWSDIEPAILGTLFERGLDPDKRSQLGAHYTDPETIMRIVEPVIRIPWELAWTREKEELAKLTSKAKKTISKAAEKRYIAFLERLKAFRVLDPACGSGNFLYLALRTLKDFEKRVRTEASELGLPGGMLFEVSPENLLGIEINAYAAELARVSVWIGELQWMIRNGYSYRKDPILRKLDQIECKDALLDGTAEAEWPKVDVIIGNPPFVGNKKLIRELGEEYVSRLRKQYEGRVPAGADLVCYWFKRGEEAISNKAASRVGLVATNSIRGGKSREVLEDIVRGSRIFTAWSDEDWINEGAAVRVSLVCFGDCEQTPVLNGKPVKTVNADLTGITDLGGVDLTQVMPLKETEGICYQGVKFVGAFEIAADVARKWLVLPNPSGKPNSDVLRKWCNGMDVTRRQTDSWIIDFGCEMSELEAAFYEAPFGHVKTHVEAARRVNRESRAGTVWWRHQRPRPEMRKALAMVKRWIATPEVAKHRIFTFMPLSVLPSGSVYAIARDDFTTLGILHSHAHAIWALRLGTSLEDRPRYTSTTCFETFPFPDGMSPTVNPEKFPSTAGGVAKAAQALLVARDQWLNPGAWVDAVPEVVPGYEYRVLPKVGYEADLETKTLTRLYNENPPWLQLLHKNLDQAVHAAYEWPWPLSDEEVIGRLFELNKKRSSGLLGV